MREKQALEVKESLTPEQVRALNSRARNLDRVDDFTMGGIFDPVMYRFLMSHMGGDNREKYQRIHKFCKNIGYASSYHDGRQIKKAIETYRAPHRSDHSWMRSLKEAYAILEERMESAHLLQLQFTSADAMWGALSHRDTAAGFTGVLEGKDHKEDFDEEETFQRFISDEVPRAKTCGSFCKPIVPAHRTQAKPAYMAGSPFISKSMIDEGKVYKDRLVWVVDLFQIFGELSFSKPFQDWFGKQWFYAGGKDDRFLSNSIRWQRGRYRRWMSIDFSSFDASLPGWLIEMAFSLIRKAFDDPNFDEELWQVVKNDFIHKTIISPWGEWVHVDDGVPSGSMFTSVVDSICNLLMSESYRIQFGRGPHHTTVCGDDNITFLFEEPTIEELNQMKDYFFKAFGTVVHPTKCTTSLTDREPEFLSREWRSLGVWRDPDVLFTKLLYPERKRDYDGYTPVDILRSYHDSFPLGMRELMTTDGILNILVGANKAHEPKKTPKTAENGLSRVRQLFGTIDAADARRAMDDMRSWTYAA